MSQTTLSHFNNCSKTEKTLITYSGALFYCEECGESVFTPVDCGHNWKPIATITSNEKIQIRNYCTKCYELDGKFLPHHEFNISKLKKVTLAKYRNYVEGLEIELLDMHQKLRQKRGDVREQSYAEYLKTPHWIDLRDQVRIRDKNTCQICLGRSRDVHHLTYDHIGCEYLFELVCLCRKCHREYYHNQRLFPGFN